jgi:hypothetical protein
MITKTIYLLLFMSFVFMYDITITPTIVSVDIEFCDANKAFEKSICSIQEAEFKSNNRLIIDQNENLQSIIIDKRTITTEKASAIFGDGVVLIQEQSIINVPSLQKSILIRPGEYKVEELRQGYKIRFH